MDMEVFLGHVRKKVLLQLKLLRDVKGNQLGFYRYIDNLDDSKTNVWLLLKIGCSLPMKNTMS